MTMPESLPQLKGRIKWSYSYRQLGNVAATASIPGARFADQWPALPRVSLHTT